MPDPVSFRTVKPGPARLVRIVGSPEIVERLHEMGIQEGDEIEIFLPGILSGPVSKLAVGQGLDLLVDRADWIE